MKQLWRRFTAEACARLRLSDAQLVGLYYARLPWASVAQLGGAGLLVGLFHPMGWWLVGAALLAVLGLVAAHGTRPSDTQIDAWLEDALGVVLDKGLERFGLTRKQLRRSDPLLVQGPVWRPQWGVARENLRVRCGADGNYRFSVRRVLVLYLTYDSLHLYSCTYDAARALYLGVGCETYPYSNIVGVKVFEPWDVGEDNHKQLERIGRKTFRPWQRFSLTFKNGEEVAIDVTVGDADRRPDQSGPTKVDEVARVVNQMLTEKQPRP